ncbi:DNA polymerase Y family protein [Kaustia mangrovi]|uniref:DNA polymerase Y family protein n=1 Tax=Kaustia mangrovi TaxID=2593653 RepID=A0A7S8C2V6_9HYPH|nr:DNA polymerase Y family protein [Kaustia mangrovi]QPC42368.1 DNA polymerase Y family protein [Kaustia mangrovi]
MRRIVSIWLPHWPIERLRRAQAGRSRKSSTSAASAPADAEPFALVAAEGQALRLHAVNAAAARAGLGAGLALADARALCPGLATRPADGPADARALTALAAWCGRYTPWTNSDGADGLWLDISGCAHLFGGEAALLDDLVGRLARLGITARAGLAGTPGAAWALARFAPPSGRIARPGQHDEALAGLPVEALRLGADSAVLLRRLGLKTVGQLYALPRASLARRFRSPELGDRVLARLDQALGLAEEPLTPLRPPPRHRARETVMEPILTLEVLDPALDRLLAALCDTLDRHGEGVRALALTVCRVDGGTARIAVETARATRTASHLKRLFRDRLERIDAGFGIETALLDAIRTEPLADSQIDLDPRSDEAAGDALARLVDRLANRLGADSVARLAPRESHIPERAERLAPVGPEKPPSCPRPTTPPRPCRLLDPPEPVRVMAEVPEGPPMRFVWRRARHRVVRAEGPERIAPEWWLESGSDYRTVRDYYRVEDEAGRRFWLYREGLYQLMETGTGGPRWFLHGLFA